MGLIYNFRYSSPIILNSSYATMITIGGSSYYRKEGVSKMSKNKYCPIHTDIETYQIIKFLAKAQGMKMTEFLEKHFKPLMQIGSTFNTNPFHLTYEFSLYPEPQLVIKAEGQSTFSIGQVDEKELEQERKAHFQQVALDIAEINNKEVKTQ